MGRLTRGSIREVDVYMDSVAICTRVNGATASRTATAYGRVPREPHTLAIGQLDSEVGMAYKYGRMGLDMLGNGNAIIFMVVAASSFVQIIETELIWVLQHFHCCINHK
jgi:hypothetical protein